MRSSCPRAAVAGSLGVARGSRASLDAFGMRANANLTLTGSSCVLVPYREEHVPTYHAWMSDPWIRRATASEPLSEAEEYAMQRDWAEDPKKCTFIVLDRARGGHARDGR